MFINFLYKKTMINTHFYFYIIDYMIDYIIDHK